MIPGTCVCGDPKTYGRTFPVRALDSHGAEFHGPKARALVLSVMPAGSSRTAGVAWTMLLMPDGRLRWALDDDGWEPVT